MVDTKTEIKFFTIPQWREEEQYLREMHKKGWKFQSVSGLGGYHFQRCQPEDVVYRLDYNQDSVSRKDEYIQTFQDCGWEYLQNFWGYSYFRKPVADMGEQEEDIFCDDESRLAMLKRVFLGRMIPLLGIFFLVIIPQIFIQLQMNNPFSQALVVFYVIMLVAYLAIFLLFGIHYWRFSKSLHE